MRPFPRRLAAVALVAVSTALAGCTPRPPNGDTGQDLAPAPAGAARGETAILRDERFDVLIAGQPAGRSMYTTRRGPEEITTTVEQALDIRRGGTPLHLEVRSEVREMEGEIRGYRLVQKLSQVETIMEGTVEGDRLVVLTRDSGGAGKAREETLPYDPETRGPHFLEEAATRALRAPGDTFEAKAFFAEMKACGKLTVTRGEEETLEIAGGKRRLARRRSRADILPGIEVTEWGDGDGTVWKRAFQLLGMPFEEIRSTGDGEPRKVDSPPELLRATSVRPDRPLENPEQVASAVYRLTLESGDFAALGIEAAFDCAGQTLVREESPAARVIRIDRVRSGKTVSLPVPASDALAEYLRPNPLIQSDDDRIRAAAREAVGSTSDAFTAARRLESWVHRNVRVKDLTTAFASARECLDRRSGDCTEHGVLLAALARASGIPARVVTGLVYYQGVFMGHMWTEVWVDRWIPLDATRGKGGVGPDHIGLGVSSLREGTASGVFFRLAQILGNLKIEILEP